jgi:hypothetical protein
MLTMFTNGPGIWRGSAGTMYVRGVLELAEAERDL